MKKLIIVCILLSACSKMYTGATGGRGAAGGNCTVSKDGNTATIICPDGTSTSVTDGAIGPVGETGATGQQGNPGINGTNGTNATPITAIQFCSNVTPVYSSHFPEFGLCLGGSLYGVYSQNGGFLALLPPGTYYSNGINASCTFTIGPNCEVIQ